MINVNSIIHKHLYFEKYRKSNSSHAGHGDTNYCSSGGGGSGWIFAESNFILWQSGDSSNSSKFLLGKSYYLTDALSISRDKKFLRPNRNDTEQGHSSNGYDKITPQ